MHSFTCIVLLLGAIAFHTAATPMPQVDDNTGVCPDKKPCTALDICSDGSYCPLGLPLDNPFEQEEDDNVCTPVHPYRAQ